MDRRAIDKAHQKIIRAKLLILAENPQALKNNIKQLSGGVERLYRLRVGSYRVIFQRYEKELLILVIRVGHRKDIYAS